MPSRCLGFAQAYGDHFRDDPQAKRRGQGHIQPLAPFGGSNRHRSGSLTDFAVAGTSQLKDVRARFARGGTR